MSVKHLKTESLVGIGPKMSSLLKNLGLETIRDLLWHIPREYLDRTKVHSLIDAPGVKFANCLVEIISHFILGRGTNRLLKVSIRDNSSKGTLICFGRPFLAKSLVPGEKYYITGTFQRWNREIQATNFEIEPFISTEADRAGLLPLYPLTDGLNQKFMRKIIRQALDTSPLVEELPDVLSKARDFPSLHDALVGIHFPANQEQLDRSRNYLVYLELFQLQLNMQRAGKKARNRRGIRRGTTGSLRFAVLERLPFQPTGDQMRALSEIEKDLTADVRMSRLLQGDVGSGKTLVSFLAALTVIEAGEQVALMAPTELLARQHAETAARFLEPVGIRIAYLAGALKSDKRKLLLEALEKGECHLLIGTHALFSDDVLFRHLGLVIIDEQQRFGVHQRESLVRKGSRPDLLLMTATPIPRTLALSAFGDMDISTIREMPAGRKPVITHLAREGNEAKVYERIKREIRQGRQAYFVYPVIDPAAGDPATIKSAESMHQYLSSQVFPENRLALVHSRIDEEEKYRRMTKFIAGEIDILVATSVVEVGVDVPNAACMVVEQAERFGLSALHQLRGRVGRGQYQSYAFLIYGKKLTEDGVRRLRVMMETCDGFRIAEEDLRIRGPGELLGARQAGYLKLKVANLLTDTGILMEARRDAAEFLEQEQK